jgi:GNAT superfamily N-acetyltransferase
VIFGGAVDKSIYISSDKQKLQIEKIYSFLSKEAYWCKNIPLNVLEKAITNSLCVGAYEGNNQVGFSRVITDYATFAWLCDVYVEKKFNGQGIAKKMIEAVMNEILPLKLRRVALTTKDAHHLYEKFGFKLTATPEYWMEIKNNEVYQTNR